MTKKLREQIFSLPKAELEQLAEEIYEKLEDNYRLTPAQKEELDRRAAEYEKDPSIGIPVEKVIAEMRAKEKKTLRSAGSGR